MKKLKQVELLDLKQYLALEQFRSDLEFEIKDVEKNLNDRSDLRQLHEELMFDIDDVETKLDERHEHIFEQCFHTTKLIADNIDKFEVNNTLEMFVNDLYCSSKEDPALFEQDNSIIKLYNLLEFTKTQRKTIQKNTKKMLDRGMKAFENETD